jgi:hypothetical protein
MGLTLVGRDVRRLLHGVWAFFRYLSSKEELEVGLGLLSATSGIARRGQPNRYMVRIANAGRGPFTCVLIISLKSVKATRRSGPREGHYAYFTKTLTVQPRASSNIVIQYDWTVQAEFQVDGVSAPPDNFWRGDIDTPQLYLVAALLRDVQGTRLDKLAVYQELMQ